MPRSTRRARTSIFICPDCQTVHQTQGGYKKHRNTEHAVHDNRLGNAAAAPVFRTYYHQALKGNKHKPPILNQLLTPWDSHRAEM